MSEGNYPWGHSRRFNAYSEFVKRSYGERVQKLTIDAGFTCPNRDGKLGVGGCTYCNNDAFNPSYCSPEKPVYQQIEEGIEFHRKRYKRASRYLAYFQAYTNTYAPVERLRDIYGEALRFDEIAGIVIGTRPDCINNEILELLTEINHKIPVTVEYGIESVYDKTLEKINRGHDFRTSIRAISETKRAGLRTGGHMIIGLPGESEEDILESAGILSELPLDQLKFHQLQIVKDTAMGRDFSKQPGRYTEFTLSEYLELMVKYLELLHPSIIVERIAGETVPRFNLRPSWGVRYDQVLRQFEELLEEKNTWQGARYIKIS